MWVLAWSNLARDWIRTVAAVLGVTFALTLIAIQVAIFLGAVESGARLVRASKADLWIVPARTTNADFAVTQPEQRRYQALGVTGVRDAGRLLMGLAIWKFSDGRQEPIVVVGVEKHNNWFNLDSSMDRSILARRAVLLDRREERRFGSSTGPLRQGERVEINGHRAEVAGFADGMTSFVVTPYVFCRYESSLDFAGVRAGNTSFVMVQCANQEGISRVQRALQQRMSDAEVLTSAEFADRSWRYWVFGTGMGMSLALSAGLAFVVGLVIVGQTMFTAVIGKLREYATMKAVGFSNRFIAGALAIQGSLIAVAGYVLALVAVLIIERYAGSGGTAVLMRMPLLLQLLLLPLAITMCLAASFAAAARAMSVAPARVFR